MKSMLHTNLRTVQRLVCIAGLLMVQPAWGIQFVTNLGPPYLQVGDGSCTSSDWTRFRSEATIIKDLVSNTYALMLVDGTGKIIYSVGQNRGTGDGTTEIAAIFDSETRVTPSASLNDWLLVLEEWGGGPGGLASQGATYTPGIVGTVLASVTFNANALDNDCPGTDTTPPTVEIQDAPTSANGNPFNVTFEFSEDVNDFTVDDISVTNGSADNFQTDDGNTYRADITADGNGDISINVNANVAQDAANNNNTAATQVVVTYDATAPGVEIQNAPTGVNNANAFNVTFEFSEDVNDFTVDDISVTNGSADNFQTTNDNTYTADITADGNGDISINVNANVAQDAANNNNTAASQVVVIYDATLPTVEIQNAPTIVNNQDTFNVTFEFSEDVSGFESGDITVSNASVSNFQTDDENTYTADITPTGDGDVTIDVAADVAVDALDNGNLAADQVIVGCGSGCNKEETIEATQHRIQNFLAKRMSIMASHHPNLSGLLTGSGIGGGFSGPSGFNINGDIDLRNGNFSFNLREFTNSMNRSKDQGKTTLHSAPGANHGPAVKNAYTSDFNLWAKSAWVNADEDRGNIDEKSDFSILHVGADYRYSKDLLIGIMAQLDETEEKSKALGSKAEGKGWLLGPYIVKRLTDKLILDLHASWGESDNEISPFGTYKDDFDTERFLFSGNLTGSMDHGNWHISPSIGLVYIKEKQEAYTDSNGFRIGSQQLELGSLNFGPTLTYRYESNNGMTIHPTIGLKGIYDFKAPDIHDVNGIAVGTEKLRGQLKLGVNILAPGGTAFTASYSYDGIGRSNYKARSIELGFSIPLNIQGTPKGTSLQGSYSLKDSVGEYDEDRPHDAMLSVRIPFD